MSILVETKKPSFGVALAFGAAVLFGLNASTTKVVMSAGVTPEQIVLFRSFSTALIAGLVMLVTNPNSFKVKKSEWKFLIAFGVIGVALMQWSYSNAVKNLPVGIALLIEYTAIVIVPIACLVLFKEKPAKKLWLGVALVLGGLMVVSKIWDSTLNPVGVLFAFGAAVFLSVYFIMGEKSQQTRDPVSTLFYTMLVSSVFWMIFSSWWNFDSAILTESIDLSGNLSGVAAPAWVLIIWIGIFGSFAPMFFSFIALGHLNATSVGVISTAETVFAFLFAYLWIGEKLDLLQLIGGILVIAGIVVAQVSRGKTKWQQSN
jgi:drug/metabolite transporter (DMT)-like permease